MQVVGAREDSHGTSADFLLNAVLDLVASLRLHLDSDSSADDGLKSLVKNGLSLQDVPSTLASGVEAGHGLLSGSHLDCVDVGHVDLRLVFLAEKFACFVLINYIDISVPFITLNINS